VLVFHQSIWAVLLASGLLPPNVYQVWSLAPVAPFGIPDIVSKCFWSGLWAIVIGLAIVRSTSGWRGWLIWTIAGAIGPTLVSILVVGPIKGQPITDLLGPRFLIGCLVNGTFGFGCAALLALAGRNPNDAAGGRRSTRT
jgi:hypothetical protein